MCLQGSDSGILRCRRAPVWLAKIYDVRVEWRYSSADAGAAAVTIPGRRTYNDQNCRGSGFWPPGVPARVMGSGGAVT